MGLPTKTENQIRGEACAMQWRMGAIVVIALSASGAIFLILEMYQPFSGLMQIDSGPSRNALASLAP